MYLKVSRYDIYSYKFRDFTLVGTSVAAHGTGFYIPELKIAFDAGVVSCAQQPESVLITHCHIDHCHYINHFGSMLKKPLYYVPNECVDYLEEYLYTQKKLSKYHDESMKKLTPDHITVGVSDKESYPIKRGNINYMIDIIKCEHSVPSVGYGISETRKKLLQKYIGVPINIIKNTDNKELYYEKKVKKICFLGDTNINVFKNSPQILEYPIVIVECTFLEASELKNAHKKFHICWTELEQIVRDNPDTTFVLIHFSNKYKNDYIEKFFKKLDIKNILPWVNLS